MIRESCLSSAPLRSHYFFLSLVAIKLTRMFSRCRLQTPLPALFPPPTLAASAILLSTLQSSSVVLPDEWWTLFDVEYDDMVCVCGWILRLYERLDSGEGKRAWKMEGKAEVRAWLAENGEAEGGKS